MNQTAAAMTLPLSSHPTSGFLPDSDPKSSPPLPPLDSFRRTIANSAPQQQNWGDLNFEESVVRRHWIGWMIGVVAAAAGVRFRGGGVGVGGALISEGRRRRRRRTVLCKTPPPPKTFRQTAVVFLQRERVKHLLLC